MHLTEVEVVPFLLRYLEYHPPYGLRPQITSVKSVAD